MSDMTAHPMAPEVAITSGDRLPELRAPTVGGDELHLPDDAAGRWAVVLLYRGHF